MAGEGTGEGTETGAGTGQNEGLWRAQLPADLKDNQAFSSFKTIGDFAKSHLEMAGKATESEGKITDYETRLSTALIKPGDKSTPEQREAFHRALGKPEKATEYEFPKGEGIEHDAKMTEWAQKTFHAANLSKEQGAVISQAWDGFITGMANAETERRAAAVQETETALKKEWGADYDKNTELARRAFKKFADTELVDFLKDTGLGNAPLLTKVFAAIGKAMGEDQSPPGGPPKGKENQVGLQYKDMDQFKSKGG